MKHLTKRSAKKWGIVLMLLYFLIGMGILIYVNSGHSMTNSKYYPSRVKSEYSGNIAVSVLFFVFSIVGIIAFYCESKVFLFIFVSLHSIIILFTFIMSIISLKINNSSIIGDYPCNVTVNSTNLPKSNIDSYLIQIDKTLCSKDCPCLINNLTQFSQINSNLSTQIVNDDKSNIVSFQQCSQEVKTKTWVSSNTTDYSISFDGNIDENNKFDFDLFIMTWAHIEETYQCSGFCVANYTNENNTVVGFNKYLFTNINNGVPKNKGCLRAISQSVTKYFGVYGGLILFIFFLQLVISFCACSFCFVREEYVYEKIYSRKNIPELKTDNNIKEGDNRI